MKINFSNYYNSLILPILAIIFWLTPHNIYSADDPVGPPAPAAPIVQNDWNNILKQNTAEFLDWAKLTASKTTNFVSEQTPLYIQEYLAWIFWENLLWVVIIFSTTIVFPILAVKFYKQIKGWDETKHNCNRHCCDVNEAGKCSLKGTDTRFGFNNVFFLFFTICSVASLITVFTAGIPSLSTVIKVKVAPRVIIVEKIKELAK